MRASIVRVGPAAPGLGAQRQRGSTLIEVLVTLIILMIGLLGLVGLMVQSQRGQMEAYQRVQALVVMQDMVNRINTNRKSAACYVTSAMSTPYLGTGGGTPTACAIGTAAQIATVARDLSEWNALLLGSAENLGGGNAGAMIGARGCVTSITTDVYRVTVAWQGTSATKAPPADASAAVNIPCAKDLYNSDGTDNLRRVVYQDVHIIDLLS
jgi:type IV pilus assembly protein PilV